MASAAPRTTNTARSLAWGLRAPRAAVRVIPRSTWIPPPVHRLIEPYLPPPPPKIRSIPPSLAPAVSPAKFADGRKVYVRRGVLREAANSPKYLPTTPAGIRSKLRPSLSVEDTAAALCSAVEMLDNQLLAPSTSDTERQRATRSDLYRLIIYQFLNRPTLPNLGAAHKLFERQHSEELPIDPKLLTVYITALLDNPFSPQSPMTSLAAIFPFLPETYDLHLLTLILSTTVRHARPPPEEVKEMIKECIPRGKGEPRAVMQSWDLELWDVYMGSLLAHGQLKEAVRSLKLFQTAVWAQQAENAKEGPDSPKYNTTPDAICRTYISLLSYWVESGFPDHHQPSRRPQDATRRKNGSNTPRAIASHCFETLRGVEPPVELLNAWLAAEVAGGNQERAERLWEVISGLKWDGRPLEQDAAESSDHRRRVLEMLSNPNWQTGTPRSTQLPADLKTDASTYTALFKLLKRLSYPPSRRLIRHFLSDTQNVNAKSLNAALSTIFTVTQPSPSLSPAKTADQLPDLPAALVLLQQFQPLLQSSTIFPLPRTLDIVAAGLIRLSHSGLDIFEQLETRITIPYGASADFGEGGMAGQRVSLREWDMISQELHALREAGDDSRGDAVMFPVGQPFARLVNELNPFPTSAEVPSDTIVRHFGSATFDRSAVARELLPALKKLLKRAIWAQIARGGEDVDEGRVEQAVAEAGNAMGLGG